MAAKAGLSRIFRMTLRTFHSKLFRNLFGPRVMTDEKKVNFTVSKTHTLAESKRKMMSILFEMLFESKRAQDDSGNPEDNQGQDLRPEYQKIIPF